MSTRWNNKTVFMIDDSERILDAQSHVFTGLGLTVVGRTQKATEALEILKASKDRPDIISLDIIMPEMHGIECYREIMKIDPKMKVIIVSVLGTDPSFIATYKNEIDPTCILGKPLSSKALEGALTLLLGPGQEAEEPPEDYASTQQTTEVPESDPEVDDDDDDLDDDAEIDEDADLNNVEESDAAK